MARQKKGLAISGWVNFDKPLDMTSTAAVSKIKWLFQAQKAGHAGTLDPKATGVLPIALGEATKTVPYLMEAEKTYRFSIRWGVTTDSYDSEGLTTATSDLRPQIDAIKAALPAFIGVIEQVPPAFSAIKVDGKRAYDLARQGIEVELKAREIEVFDLELISASQDEAEFLLHCSKGTYVRSIARDLCLDLGVCGHVSALRRERVGTFQLDTIISLENLEDLVHRGAPFVALLKLETALDDIPALALNSDEAAKIRQGRDFALLPQRLATIKEALRTRLELGFTEYPDHVQLRFEDKVLALAELKNERIYPVRVLNL